MEQVANFRTGVKSLDMFLGGEDNPGLPDKSVILVLGDPGTKFENFTQQVLFHVLRGGSTDKVIYLSYDGRPHEIVDELSIYDYHLEPFMSDNRWTFMDAFTARIAAEGAVIGLQNLPGANFESEEMPQDSLRFFSRRFIPELLKYDRVSTCIHSMSSLIRSNSIESVSIAIETLKHIVRARSGIHFLLMIKNMHPPEVEVLSSHLADFVFEIRFGKVGGGKISIDFEVRKSWKSTLLPISVPMSIDRRGIRLETTVRV